MLKTFPDLPVCFSKINSLHMFGGNNSSCWLVTHVFQNFIHSPARHLKRRVVTFVGNREVLNFLPHSTTNYNLDCAMKSQFYRLLPAETEETTMTIPTRPAPPPPGRNQPASNLASAPSHNASSSSVTVNKFATNKKQAPPRPPPPKALATATSLIKKSGSQKSISILSNLFSASKNSSKITDKTSHTSAELKMPPKIPAPPSHLTSRHHQHQHQELQSIQPVRNDAQLINFDESPASSPPSIKKSNTGSDSMDSFCSSNSSPNNLGFNSGTTSQAER